MDKNANYEQATSWISTQTTEISGHPFGRNAANDKETVDTLTSRTLIVGQQKDIVDRLVQKTSDAEKKGNLEKSYKSLQAVSEKKVADARLMVGVTALEDNCNRVSRDIDTEALQLARQSQQQLQQQQQQQQEDQQQSKTDIQNMSGFIASIAQESIFGLRDNWTWITTLVKCVDIHLKNAANYHQFFHEVKETEPWLIEDMLKMSTCLDSHEMTTATDDQTKRVLEELMAVLVSLRQWECRLNRIWDTAVGLVRLSLRVDGVGQPTPASILADYKTSQISLREGEDVLLVDNTDTKMWKVRSGKDQEAVVPAVIVLIPGTDPAVIEAAVRLRLELLAAWTNAMKKIGARIIQYLLLVFKPTYSEREISSLTSVKDIDKQSLLHQLSFIEDTLQKHWADHDGFTALQERILALRFILEETGDSDQKDDKLFREMQLQITTLAQIIELYQSMFKDWEKYKVALEASRQPELMLIVDKWEQLQFVSRDFFAKFWKTKMPLGGDGVDGVDALNKMMIDGEQVEDSVKTAFTSSLSTTETSDGGTLVFDVPDIVDPSLLLQSQAGGGGAGDTTAVFTTTFSTDGLSSAGGDGSQGGKTEVTVNVDGTGGGGGGGKREIRVAQVKVVGVGTPGGDGDDGSSSYDEGSYGEGFKEIREAQFGRTVSSEQEGTDFGMATERKTAETEQLTAAEMEEKKTFTIKSVVNPEDGTEISFQQAVLMGIIRPDEGVYVDSRTAETKPIPVAMAEGLIKVMYTTTKRSKEKTSSVGIITVKTIREPVRPYTVVSVRDTRSGQDVDGPTAESAGLVDSSRGSYIDRQTGRRYMIAEAADAGLVKLEYTGPQPEPEVISKTYAVRAVVDRRQKKTITFHEAVRRGIIDRESGAYKDTQTGDKMYIGDAIMRGFLKARIIDDASGLNIDPQNRMVIDKTEKIRKRLLKPLSVISAFKSAAAAASK
jgi:hypothetical protein